MINQSILQVIYTHKNQIENTLNLITNITYFLFSLSHYLMFIFFIQIITILILLYYLVSFMIFSLLILSPIKSNYSISNVSFFQDQHIIYTSLNSSQHLFQILIAFLSFNSTSIYINLFFYPLIIFLLSSLSRFYLRIFYHNLNNTQIINYYYLLNKLIQGYDQDDIIGIFINFYLRLHLFT